MKILFEGGDMDGQTIEIADMARGVPDHILSQAGIYSPTGRTVEGTWIFEWDDEANVLLHGDAKLDAMMHEVFEEILADLRRTVQRRAELN